MIAMQISLNKCMVLDYYIQSSHWWPTYVQYAVSHIATINFDWGSDLESY